MDLIRRLLILVSITLLPMALAGCPPTDDDDSSDDDDASADEQGELCTGSGPNNGCVNAPNNQCPSVEPSDGNACNFNGNCHYCDPGSDQARGYTCDGSSFNLVGTFDCNP